MIVATVNSLAVDVEVPIGQRSSSDCLQSTKRLFGAEIQPQLHLFEVNKDYALQLQIVDDCKITKIKVAPKYFWEEFNTVWKEPDYSVWLSEKDYPDLLAKVGQIKKIGPLIREGTIGVISNTRLWLWDQYEEAFVERGMKCCSGEQNSGSSGQVWTFSIYFIRSVEGQIEDKTYRTLPDGSKRRHLKIEGRWYLTTTEEFEKARIGERSSLKVAGPIS
jgi:hypothetical protein